MKLIGTHTRRVAATIEGDAICLPKGGRYTIEGYAAVDTDGIAGEPEKVVATFDGRTLWTLDGMRDAVVGVECQ